MSNGQAGKNCYLSDFFRNVQLDPVTIDGETKYIINPISFEFVWNDDCDKQLSNLIVNRLIRKNLYRQNPKFLGYDDKTVLVKGSDAFEDLFQTVLCECVLKPAGDLRDLVFSQDNVTGCIKRNINWVLLRKQREFDPVNINVFKIVRAASVDAVTKRKLEIELKGLTFSKEAVLVLNSNRNDADRRLFHKDEILYLFDKEETRIQENWEPQRFDEIAPSFFDDFDCPTKYDTKSKKLKISDASNKVLKMLENIADKENCINVVINVEDLIEVLKTKVNLRRMDKFYFYGVPNRLGEVVIEGEEGEAVLTTQDQFTKDNSISRLEAFDKFFDKLKCYVQNKINNNPTWRNNTKNNYLKAYNKFYNVNKDLVIKGKPLQDLLQDIDIDSIQEITQRGSSQAYIMLEELNKMISESWEEIIKEDKNDLDFLC